VAKPIQLQQIGTQIYGSLIGFSEQRFTGQVQFHITMNQGGVSRVSMVTQANFGYDRTVADERSAEVAKPPPPQNSAPPIGLIATMSKKE